jgi:hypothetical protein
MKHKQYKAYNQDDVNKSGRYVERNEPGQPKNDQNRGDILNRLLESLRSDSSEAEHRRLPKIEESIRLLAILQNFPQ